MPFCSQNMLCDSCHKHHTNNFICDRCREWTCYNCGRAYEIECSIFPNPVHLCWRCYFHLTLVGIECDELEVEI